MFRTSWLSTLMSSAVCALVATSTIGEAVFAQIPGQRRVIYKISDINQFDVDEFCRLRYGKYTSARLDPERDRVMCGTRRSSTQTQTGGQAGTSGVNGTRNVTVNDPEWKEEFHHLSEVCENKHPTKGTWVGDGGRSCYDSYWRW